MNFFFFSNSCRSLGRQPLSVPSPGVAGLWIAIAAGSVCKSPEPRSEVVVAGWKSDFDSGEYRWA